MRRLLAWLALFSVFAPSAVAETRAARFEDGRSMAVERAEEQQGLVYLSLVGGGEIAVAAERILNLKALLAPAPAKPDIAESPDSHDGAAYWRQVAGDYAALIEGAALRHELDPALLAAMAQAESAFDPLAVSPKGACGMLQLMPDTADRFGVEDVFDPDANVDGGARYMRWLLERFDGRTDLALAGYNAGEGAVDRYQGIPPYRETRTYVDRVLADAAVMARRAP